MLIQSATPGKNFVISQNFKFILIYQTVRQKGFHILNSPPGFNQVFGLIKSFMKEKAKSRVINQFINRNHQVFNDFSHRFKFMVLI
jgi:hypothetical protein